LSCLYVFWRKARSATSSSSLLMLLMLAMLESMLMYHTMRLRQGQCTCVGNLTGIAPTHRGSRRTKMLLLLLLLRRACSGLGSAASARQQRSSAGWTEARMLDPLNQAGAMEKMTARQLLCLLHGIAAVNRHTGRPTNELLSEKEAT
jgi:hypothetical protein